MRPLLFKIYRDLEPTALPLDTTPLGVPALQAIAENGATAGTKQAVDVRTLARIFHFSAGITKTLTLGSGTRLPFRAAACTGALYHVELYLVCGDVPGLAAGVYHLDPRGPAIRQLRRGEYRRALIEASGHEPAVTQAPAIFVATDVTWRNAVKYQAREYRHAFWDSGTLLANTLAMAAAHHLAAKVVAGFVDTTVSELLDLDAQREVPVALVPIGVAAHMESPAVRALPALDLAVMPVSDGEIDFPAIRAMQQASSLPDADAVAAWRRATPARQTKPSGASIPLPPVGDVLLPGDALEAVIVRRGSTRQFRRAALTFAQLAVVLRQSLQGVPADFNGGAGGMLSDIYLTVHAVDGLVPGAYVLQREAWALELLQPGDFREVSGFLGLDQELAADASVDVFFLADLPPILDCFGNRGYRAAQLDASIAAGRMYLAAYAQRFGATGLTFYDDAVVEFFSPHAAGKSVMFLLALGHRAYQTV
jgi:SagB-type dehydrogenase family enzyme